MASREPKVNLDRFLLPEGPILPEHVHRLYTLSPPPSPVEVRAIMDEMRRRDRVGAKDPDAWRTAVIVGNVPGR